MFATLAIALIFAAATCRANHAPGYYAPGAHSPDAHSPGAYAYAPEPPGQPLRLPGEACGKGLYYDSCGECGGANSCEKPFVAIPGKCTVGIYRDAACRYVAQDRPGYPPYIFGQVGTELRSTCQIYTTSGSECGRSSATCTDINIGLKCSASGRVNLSLGGDDGCRPGAEEVTPMQCRALDHEEFTKGKSATLYAIVSDGCCAPAPASSAPSEDNGSGSGNSNDVTHVTLTLAAIGAAAMAQF